MENRKNQFAIAAVICAHHDLSGDLPHAFEIAKHGLEIREIRRLVELGLKVKR